MQQQIFEEQEDNIDIQKIIGKYLQHWKWILLFTFVFCGTAYFYLKVQPSTFISSSTVLVKDRSEEHTSELQSRPHLVCRLLLEKKKKRHQPRCVQQCRTD